MTSEVGKHTLGPWIVATSCSWRRIVNESMEPVCIPVIQRSDNHPDLHFPNGGPDGPDARAMIAAPALLEALKAYRKLHDLAAIRDPKEWLARLQEARDMADEALALAQGERE